MLEIDFIFANQEGHSKVGFRELIIALSKAPHESLFATELIIVLVEHFWDRYFKAIFFRCFIPFIIYFLLTIFYMSKFAVEGIAADAVWDLTFEFFARWIVVALTCYFAYFEVYVCFRDGLSYFTDIFNYLEWSSFFLNLYLVYSTCSVDPEEEGDRTTIRGLCAFAVVLMWLKAFYWMRIFTPTSFYVRLIVETLYDIRYFLILFVFILMTFANALLILSETRDDPLYTNYFSIAFINAVMNQYMLSLGEFDTENFKLDGADPLVWMVFIGTTFITQITFLNMLIAIMGDTFDRVSEVKEQSALVEKVRILADYVVVVKRESIERGDLSRFIVAITPKALGKDEAGTWEGTVTQLKKCIDTSMAQMKQQLNKRVGSVQGEVAAVNARLGSLDDKLNELHGSQQRLPSMEKIERSMRNILGEALNGVPYDGN